MHARWADFTREVEEEQIKPEAKPTIEGGKSSTWTSTSFVANLGLDPNSSCQLLVTRRQLKKGKNVLSSQLHNGYSIQREEIQMILVHVTELSFVCAGTSLRPRWKPILISPRKLSAGNQAYITRTR